jgi:hypothetical protein
MLLQLLSLQVMQERQLEKPKQLQAWGLMLLE